MEDVTSMDLYELLAISDDAGEKEIKTAYRKKALKCHPDKNPDNPTASLLFHQLSKALEILTDGKAKAAYDKILKGRKAAAVRNRQLDSKRKKLKEDLESREKDAELRQTETIDAGKKLKAEIERLRKEGSRQLEAEIESMKQQIKEERDRLNATTNDMDEDTRSNLPRIKVQWKQAKGQTPPYDQDALSAIFSKYGEISCLALSSKRRALVEFKKLFPAMESVTNETGIPEFPLQVTWLNEPVTEPPPSKVVNPPSQFAFGSKSVNNDGDYESIVLMRMRQAQERKRLIEKIEAEETNGSS